RGGSNHRRTANINLLNRLGFSDVFADDRLFEWVEIDHNHVDWLNSVFAHGRNMFCLVAQSEQCAVNLRMQSLDPAVHHFRETGYRGNVTDVDAVFAEDRCRASGTDDFDAKLFEFAREIDDARFV